MNMSDIIEKKFSVLFINYFDDIKITNEIIDDYKWKNISQIFENLYENLIELTEQSEFIKNYYLITLLYINYTNFLKFINHPDSDIQEILDFINKIKYNQKIIKYISKNLCNNNIFQNIFSTFNPFIENKFKLLNEINTVSNQQFNNLIVNVKKLETYYLDNNISSKKLLNIILYKYILSNNLNETNFHNFFVKNIIGHTLDYDIDAEIFFSNLSDYKYISNMDVSEELRHNLGINILEIINFIVNGNKNIFVNTILNKDKTKVYEIHNKKIDGKIVIKKSSTKTNDINIYQQNINLIGFGIKELKNFSFIKKTKNFMIIEYNSSTINNLTNLLHLIHLLTCGIKLLETCPSSISECVYPIDYNKYYYNTFINFLTFIKSEINKDMSYNRFLIDLIKFYYIYSYYDYYFYYNTNLVKTIIDRLQYKNNIFTEFCESLKLIFKLPPEMTNYPPFFRTDDDINNLIYYSFEIPNYFKFLDLINAIINVFNINIRNPKKFDLSNIISAIKTINTINTTGNEPKINNSKIDEPKSNNLKIDKPLKIDKNNDKTDKNNDNAYVELNADGSDNYVLDTELH